MVFIINQFQSPTAVVTGIPRTIAMGEPRYLPLNFDTDP